MQWSNLDSKHPKNIHNFPINAVSWHDQPFACWTVPYFHATSISPCVSNLHFMTCGNFTSNKETNSRCHKCHKPMIWSKLNFKRLNIFICIYKHCYIAMASSTLAIHLESYLTTSTHKRWYSHFEENQIRILCQKLVIKLRHVLRS
jgi:hypothetical protein